MSTRLIPLRYPGSCVRCGELQPARTKAYFDDDRRSVTCLNCGASVTDALPDAPLPIDHGTAGASPMKEYQRRAAKREQQIDERWGRLAPVVKFVSSEPQSTTAWRQGADGEERLGRFLDRELAGHATMLHSRRVPGKRSDIDHIVIASSGVWVIDAKNCTGKVEARDVGNWRTRDMHLFVNGRDQQKLVDGTAWQVQAVRSALESVGLADVPIHPVLCFTNSDWGLFSKGITIGGVRVLWGKKLRELVLQPGSLDPDTCVNIAQVLSVRLPAAG